LKDEFGRAASVRARLANLARERGVNLEFYLVRYAHERLLYRIGQSQYRQRLILKGAMLQTVWLDNPFRPTRDLDLAGFGYDDPAGIRKMFQEILSIPADDGIIFDVAGVSVEPIREANAYGGLRLETHAHLAGARLKIQVDIGFGDAVTPEPLDIDYPVLLDGPSPKVRAYPKETVVGEKLQAITVLGKQNGRMKDFYDLWMMSRHLEFDVEELAKAIAATFARRRTPISDSPPVGLTEEFSNDPDAIRRWDYFINRNVLSEAPPSLAETVAALRRFLSPAMRKAAKLALPSNK
jgi:predicted nucleotidyltransferase component of viral defense system